MDDRGNKRDLVLAPGEYAYMQDVTKGVIKTYTGPTVINPTAQERPIVFRERKFDPCSLDEAVQRSAICPEGHYLILKNPSMKGDHPTPGGVYPSPELHVGRKINVTGPCDFALWPGQMVQLVRGHHLRSNQYLLIRVYNEEEARKNWSTAVVKPAAEGPPPSSTSAGPVPGIGAPPADLTVGRLLVIKGTDVSFYIPPTGISVVPDEHESYVRDALTLERLEYCILVEQNGKKRYERGPQVVFPEPTESFITRDGMRKFRALELNELQGLHIKVIAPYVESGREYKEGDELFITGRETAIYFPREEHSIVRYDGRDKHFAVAIPAGEGRYVMKRRTGDIEVARGPAMLLPNPIDEVIVRRVLTEKECATWYPGNTEVAAYNRNLRQLAQQAATSPGGRPGPVAEAEIERQQLKKPTAPAAQQQRMEAKEALVGDVLDRQNQFTPPRTIVFHQKFEGIPSVNIWVGYAVMVVDKKGGRRVEQGPKNLLLGYDESLEVVQLSTGQPKSEDNTIQTVFLRVLNNKVSDICEVETSDHVQMRLRYALRVNFTGDAQRWFEVENYVKFLCDHVRSVLKGFVRKQTVEAFSSAAIDLVRDCVLGRPVEGAGTKAERPGMRFAENGMHVTDVEVLDVTIDDARIAELLQQAQHEAVESNITLLRSARHLDVTRRQEEIEREEAAARAETTRQKAQLEIDAANARLAVALSQVAGSIKEFEEKKTAVAAKNAVLDVEHAAQLKRDRATAEQQQEREAAQQALRLQALTAEVDAVVRRFDAAQDGFAEALLAMSNQDMLARVAEAMSVQAFVGGKTLTDVVDKVFAGTPLQGVMDKVKQKALAAPAATTTAPPARPG
jgi:major vault protein